MKKFLIGDITKKYGISQDTLRYYDKAGLLPFVKKNQAGRREFTEDDLGYIEVIDCLKRSGIPVKEIAKFMDWCVEGDKTLPQRYAFMVEQEAALEKKFMIYRHNLIFYAGKNGTIKRPTRLAQRQSSLKKERGRSMINGIRNIVNQKDLNPDKIQVFFSL